MFEEAKEAKNATIFRDSIQAYMQLDSNVHVGWYPQISLLDELHEKKPNSTFVINFRPILDWIRSTANWHGMHYRMSMFEVPGLIMTDEQRVKLEQYGEYSSLKERDSQQRTRKPKIILLSNAQMARWWCSHVRHIREYVKQYPSHKLIELDLYDKKGTSKVLYDLFQADTDIESSQQESCWVHANSNNQTIR